MPKANNEASHSWRNLKRLAYFVAVVETGSFTAAADRLGITKAVVSQQVAQLEQELQTTLLLRSTRRVQPTASGQAFYQRCAALLADADSAFGELAAIAAAPSGLLRLSAPLDYGIHVVVPAITAFTQRYPQCQVDARFSDQAADLMTGEIELAIRVGWLTDLHLQARQIGSFRQLLVAAPHWQSPELTLPEQLASRPFIANTALRNPRHWDFTHAASGQPQAIELAAVIHLNATLAVRQAVLAGAGLSVLPDYAVAEDLAAGRLVQLLPDWTLPSGGIHAVYPPTRFRPARVGAFVGMLVGGENHGA